MLLSNKVALITGGGRGIGKAIALEFSREGATVNIVDIQAEDGNKTINEITNNNSCGYFYQADVSDYNKADEIINAVANKYKKLDILVNVAGKGQRKPFIEIDEQIWEQTFAVNCKGVFNYCHAAAKLMVKQREGCIINTASVAGIRGGGLLSKNAYVAAKAAVIGLTKGLANELATYNIRVNCIAPGLHITPATEALSEEDKTRTLKQIPLGRGGDPKDLAKAVTFLASSAANFITGETLVVDGGFAML